MIINKVLQIKITLKHSLKYRKYVKKISNAKTDIYDSIKHKKIKK